MNMAVKIIDRIFAFLGAVIFMQVPQFIQDYVHVLYGHLAELTWQLDQMRTMAAKSGKTIAELSAKFLKNADSDIVFQGELIDKLIKREDAFASALQALTEAGPFTKSFLFLRHSNSEIVKETWKHFKLGLPLTLEAIFWGLIGLFLGYLLFTLLKKLLRSLSSLFS